MVGMRGELLPQPYPFALFGDIFDSLTPCADKIWVAFGVDTFNSSYARNF